MSGKIDWIKRNKAYKLGGLDSPISTHAVKSSIEETPVCASTYGDFPPEVLTWIDNQEVPPWSNFESSEDIERRYADLTLIYKYLPKKHQPLAAKVREKEVTEIIKARRSRFNKNRDQLILAMLHAGRAYICANASCGEMRSLHVDHIIPLSKGGTDELNNLQFLCQKHNSEKGAKYPRPS
ncbi:MAG: HNH endonuclease [Candidatus Berkelbacteria bacterium]|nr:HNH endonuclease [Candidatus Berkelbacteria bacterium]